MRDPRPREVNGLKLITRYLHQEAESLLQLVLKKSPSSGPPGGVCWPGQHLPSPMVGQDDAMRCLSPSHATIGWRRALLSKQSRGCGPSLGGGRGQYK